MLNVDDSTQNSRFLKRLKLSIAPCSGITTRCTGLEQLTSLGKFWCDEKNFVVSALPYAVPAGERGVMRQKNSKCFTNDLVE